MKSDNVKDKLLNISYLKCYEDWLQKLRNLNIPIDKLVRAKYPVQEWFDDYLTKIENGDL